MQNHRITAPFVLREYNDLASSQPHSIKRRTLIARLNERRYSKCVKCGKAATFLGKLRKVTLPFCKDHKQMAISMMRQDVIEQNGASA